MTEKEQAEILELRRLGLSLKKISEATGKCVRVVQRVIRQADGEVKRHELKGEELEKCRALRETGMTLDEIGYVMGFSPTTVGNKLRQEAKEGKSKPKEADEEQTKSEAMKRDQILALHEAGYVDKEIAERMRMAKSTVYRVIQEAIGLRAPEKSTILKKGEKEKKDRGLKREAAIAAARRKIMSREEKMAVINRQKFGANRFDSIMIDLMDGVKDEELLEWYKHWNVDANDLKRYRIMFQAITRTPRRLRNYLAMLPNGTLEKRREKREKYFIHRAGRADRDGSDEHAL